MGPTASGKTMMSVLLAKKFGVARHKSAPGVEIISADSRQVYKGLDVGSGKISKKEMRGIPHHLLSVANPKRKFTVSQFQKLALRAIKKIQVQGNVPFLVGGTGFYIQSIVDGIVFPEVKPSRALRARLQKKSIAELFLMLKDLDPARAKSIDPKNPRRLIRALEIVIITGNPVQKLHGRGNSVHGQFDILQIGISKSKIEIKKAIQKRLQKRLKGMIGEVKKLNKNGLPWKRLEELGLEYRAVAQYIQGKLTRQAMIDKIQKESEQFAKRQMTWFKRDKRIHWIKSHKEAEELIEGFL